MTEPKTSFTYVTYIRTTPQKVFEAITRADITKQFWGHENVSDWKPGSRWRHIRANNERTVEIVGKVVEVSPPGRLVTTWAAESLSDRPDSFSRVTYEIEDYDSMVKLTVIHDKLEADGGMAPGISKGWPLILSSMKSFLENGSGIDLSAKPRTA